jgi:hypothetical protein
MCKHEKIIKFMKKYLKHLTLILLSVSSLNVTWANDEGNLLIENLNSCIRMNASNVAKVVTSLEEGAMLITESLCANENSSAANYLARTVEDPSRQNFIDRYHNWVYINKRDIKNFLYKEKLTQNIVNKR